jgi:hypothetical protein
MSVDEIIGEIKNLPVDDRLNLVATLVRKYHLEHTPETEQLAEFRQHLVAWIDARRAAEFSLALESRQPKPEENDQLARLLSFYAVVAYARPFGKNNGLSRLGEKGNFKLISLRNEIAAHTDASRHSYLADVFIKSGEVARNAVPATRLIPFMDEVISECTKEIDKISEKIKALEDQIDKLNLPDGKYGPA